MKITIFHRGVF